MHTVWWHHRRHYTAQNPCDTWLQSGLLQAIGGFPLYTLLLEMSSSTTHLRFIKVNMHIFTTCYNFRIILLLIDLTNSYTGYLPSCLKRATPSMMSYFSHGLICLDTLVSEYNKAHIKKVHSSGEMYSPFLQPIFYKELYRLRNTIDKYPSIRFFYFFDK